MCWAGDVAALLSSYYSQQSSVRSATLFVSVRPSAPHCPSVRVLLLRPRARSIVMSASVCLSVCMCVFVYTSVHSPQLVVGSPYSITERGVPELIQLATAGAESAVYVCLLTRAREWVIVISMRVCVSVCVSICDNISGTTCPTIPTCAHYQLPFIYYGRREHKHSFKILMSSGVCLQKLSLLHTSIVARIVNFCRQRWTSGVKNWRLSSVELS